MLQVIITVGAASAAWGIVQYGLFNYDNLGQRPQGTLGHYMTYSGLLMLVIARRVARLLFGRTTARGRRCPAGAARRARADVHPQRLGRRLRGGGAAARAEGLPPAAGDPDRRGRVLRVAPPQITARFYSIFDLKDPTSRDRVAMLHDGVAMVKAHPLTGVGPNMVQRLYAQYRDPTRSRRSTRTCTTCRCRSPPSADCRRSPRGCASSASRRSISRGCCGAAATRRLPAAALAAIAGMLAAGLFEYNFGDSEFLMLFLVLVTLPFAAERPDLP